MSEKRYFGGSTVKGTVRRLNATTFKGLVEGYFNCPVVKKFARKEYDSYDIDTQKKQKDGPFITAAVFKGDDVERKNENCVALSLALLDFDSLERKDVDEGFVDYATQLYEAPEVIRDQLHPYNFVCYETISSRKGSRRVRILVDLEEMSVDMHKKAVAHIASLLGVDVGRWKGRIESMTLSLPMFRPVQFQSEDFTAVLASRTDGVEMEDLDIPEFVQDDDSDNRSYGYEGTGDDSADMMHLPVYGLSVEDIGKVIEHINPDESYPIWVKIGMALRHQFRGDEEAKQAYDLFDDWSSRGNKYVDEDETYKKWKAFRPDATGRAPVTIRSLFEIAKSAGWDPSTLAKKVKKDLSSWIKRVVDPDELMQVGPLKVAALPFKDEVTEEALALEIQAKIKDLKGVPVSVTTIKKAIRRCRRQKSMDEDTEVPTWARPWVYITVKNKFRNLTNGIELSPESFNRTFAIKLMNLSAESDSAVTGKPTMQPSDFLLNVKNAKRVDGTTYDPRNSGEEPYFVYDGREYLNEYRMSTIPKLDEANAKKAGKIFTNAVRWLVGDEHFKIVMDFFAHTIQRPGVLIRWALLIQSAQGAGKNMVLNAVGHALGYDANYKVINAKRVLSNFNDWISGAQLIVLDEIKIPGQSKAELSNDLKDLITNDKVSVEAKFEKLEIIQNVANKVALTNWEDPLHLEGSDRRWMPIKSPVQTVEDCAALFDSGAFSKLERLYKFGGALRQFLLDWEIDKDFPTNGPAPKTRFRSQMIVASKTAIQEQIEDLIESPQHPLIGEDIIFTPFLSSALGDFKTNQKPSHFLRLLGYELYSDGRKVLLSGHRGTIWVHKVRHEAEYGDPLAILTDRVANEEEKDF